MGWTNTEKNVGTREWEGNHLLTVVLMPTIASRITGSVEPQNLFHSGGKPDNKNSITQKDLISFMYLTCCVMLQITYNQCLYWLEGVQIYGEHTWAICKYLHLKS